MKTYEAKTYELRNVGYCSYALITLTDLQSNVGTISIVSDFNTANEYAYVINQEGEALWEVFDFESMPCVRTYAPGIRYFMEEVWPVFIKELN